MLSRLMVRAALAASLLAAAAASLRAEEPHVLKIATEGAFEPFNYTDPAGKVQGFDIDLTNAVCAKAGLTCDWIRQDWDGLIPGLLAGKFDAISASVSITDERKKKVDFSDTLYRTALRFAAKTDTLKSDDPAALTGKTIGAQRATIASTYLQQHYGTSNVKLYDTQDALRLDLTAGRLDAMLADEVAVTRGFLSKPEGSGFAFFGAPIKVGDGIGIVVPKGHPDLLKMLNEGIAAVRQDGTFKTLNDRYFPGSDLS